MHFVSQALMVAQEELNNSPSVLRGRPRGRRRGKARPAPKTSLLFFERWVHKQWMNEQQQINFSDVFGANIWFVFVKYVYKYLWPAAEISIQVYKIIAETTIEKWVVCFSFYSFEDKTSKDYHLRKTKPWINLFGPISSSALPNWIYVF